MTCFDHAARDMNPHLSRLPHPRIRASLLHTHSDGPTLLAMTVHFDKTIADHAEDVF